MSVPVQHVECSLVRSDWLVASVRPVSPMHDEHELLLVGNGVYRGRVSGRPLTLRVGEALCLPAGCEHGREPGVDGQLRLFVLRWRGGPKLTEPFQIVDRERHLALGCAWLHGLPRPCPRPTYLDALTTALVEEACRLRDGWTTVHDPIAAAEALLTSRPELPYHAADLAQRAGMSLPTFNRRFRQRFGVSPMLCLQRIRVERAAALLATGGGDLASVARSVGFRSAAHLSRLLRRSYGFSASELRRRGRQT